MASLHRLVAWFTAALNRLLNPELVLLTLDRSVPIAARADQRDPDCQIVDFTANGMATRMRVAEVEPAGMTLVYAWMAEQGDGLGTGL